MLNSVLTTSPQYLGQMADEVRLNVQKRFNFFFTEKDISFSWTVRLLFWRSLLKMFDVGPLFLSALSENEEKVIIFFLISFPQIVPMDKWNAFLTIPTKMSCDKAWKFSLIVRKWYKILISSKQRIFPRHVLRHT